MHMNECISECVGKYVGNYIGLFFVLHNLVYISIKHAYVIALLNAITVTYPSCLLLLKPEANVQTL